MPVQVTKPDQTAPPISTAGGYRVERLGHRHGDWLVAVLPRRRSAAGGSAEGSSALPRRVVAQGQILPAAGIVRIYSTPGDTLVSLPVKVGQRVEAGEILAVLRSQAAIAAQRATLQQQRRTAQLEQDNAVRQAELQLQAAQLKLQQVQLRRQAWSEQIELIESGEQQLTTSTRILQSLHRIAADELTREFVGRLDIDRQHLAVEEARLQLQQQQQSHLQTGRELELAATAARQEVSAAEAALAMARQADPARILELQLEALETDAQRAVVQAPGRGVVLAIHAAPGGAAVQSPLIELADLEQLVCEAEVNVVDAGKIQIGQPAIIRSRAFADALHGRVIERSRLVGRPRLRSLILWRRSTIGR